MFRSPDDFGYDRDKDDGQFSTATFYMTLLSEHDQAAMAGRPLLTEEGVAHLQHLLNDCRHSATMSAKGLRWDDEDFQLFLDGKLLKEFRRSAPAQTAILAAFEALGWPNGPVSDPLPRDPHESKEDWRRRLQETVKNLNKTLPSNTLHFREARGRVWWERLPPTEPGANS